VLLALSLADVSLLEAGQLRDRRHKALPLQSRHGTAAEFPYALGLSIYQEVKQKAKLSANALTIDGKAPL